MVSPICHSPISPYIGTRYHRNLFLTLNPHLKHPPLKPPSPPPPNQPPNQPPTQPPNQPPKQPPKQPPNSPPPFNPPIHSPHSTPQLNPPIQPPNSTPQFNPQMTPPPPFLRLFPSQRGALRRCFGARPRGARAWADALRGHVPSSRQGGGELAAAPSAPVALGESRRARCTRLLGACRDWVGSPC